MRGLKSCSCEGSGEPSDGGGGQRRPRAGEDVAERALGDRQAEHLAHQCAQPLKPDRMDVVQVDDHRLD